ncbi:MAG: class I poly(R)-hydroxyalkanoic acid synthase [Boseongicola sp. SB0675_bin_26]|nr:class I poly(R)-hydroxyalkanoic acid synthase [Boseongicola sp. SB0675_bin_26]
MTTEEIGDDPDRSEELHKNLARIEELSERLVAAISRKKAPNPDLQAPGQELYTKAASAYVAEFVESPSKVFETQVAYWSKALTHFVEAQKNLMQGSLEPPDDNTPADPRFAGDLWAQHPYFNFIKQQYLISAEAISNAVDGLDDLNETDRRRVRYFTRQIIDMMSPANFLGTNPEALAKAAETNGQSLVDGLENLVRDIEESDGEPMVTLADKKAFEVGANIGSTEGSVVFRNEILELIQYAPTTQTVRETPLLVFPPWINKYYILDLKPKNSLIRWIVDQGYTLFVVSWKNPDASYRDFGMADYVEKGFLTAIDQAKAVTGEKRINVVGYCIGGTALSLTLALLEKRGDRSIGCATFFTTLTDFKDQGEFTVFLTDDFVDAIEAQSNKVGVLENRIMSRTFSFLRSNDLIYGPAIRSYLMGEAPPAFDLLYWNGDGTHLPAAMLMEYLRGLCQQNRFAREGFDLLGETVRVGDIRVPACSVACETDHIAAWKSCYEGFRQMGSNSKTFLLSESGHIAGIVNPPSRNKYGHYTGHGLPAEPEAWKDAATFNEGSWWPTWGRWLEARSGSDTEARVPGTAQSHPILAAAPGTYVKEVVGID